MFGLVVTGGPNLFAVVGWSLPWIAVGVAAAAEARRGPEHHAPGPPRR